MAAAAMAAAPRLCQWMSRVGAEGAEEGAAALAVAEAAADMTVTKRCVDVCCVRACMCVCMRTGVHA